MAEAARFPLAMDGGDDWLMEMAQDEDIMILFPQREVPPPDLPLLARGGPDRRAIALLQFQRHMAHRRVMMQAVVEERLQQVAAGNACEMRGCRICTEKRYHLALPGQQNKFTPTTLKQSILLEWIYRFFDAKMVDQIGSIPLPDLLLADFRQGCDELKRFRGEFSTQVSSKVISCYHRHIVWYPNSTRIDDRRTAEMIVDNSAIPAAQRFKLAALNCLEEKMMPLWQAVQLSAQNFFQNQAGGVAGAARLLMNVSDFGVRDFNSSSSTADHNFNLVINYWIERCLANNTECPSKPVINYIHPCIKYALKKNNLDVMDFFMRQLEEVAIFDQKPESLQWAFDHFFHMAIEMRNRPAAMYLWQNSRMEQHESMLSAASCCGTKNGFHSFQVAVAEGFYEMVKFMWDKTDDRQHNTMLLSDHCGSFCSAASAGHTDIVKLLWSGTSKNQKFLLLFEQNCKALRGSCAGGHLEIVQILWSDVLSDQRKQMLSVCNYEAIRIAAENGHLQLIQFLWQAAATDYTGDLSRFFLNCVLRPAMCAAATAGQYQILEFLVVSANDYGDMGKGFLQRTLVAGDYEVIKLAAGNCRWPIVEWLSSLLGENDKVKVESKIATIRQFEPIQLVREMFDEDSPSAGEI